MLVNRKLAYQYQEAMQFTTAVNCCAAMVGETGRMCSIHYKYYNFHLKRFKVVQTLQPILNYKQHSLQANCLSVYLADESVVYSFLSQRHHSAMFGIKIQLPVINFHLDFP